MTSPCPVAPPVDAEQGVLALVSTQRGADPHDDMAARQDQLGPVGAAEDRAAGTAVVISEDRTIFGNP